MSQFLSRTAMQKYKRGRRTTINLLLTLLIFGTLLMFYEEDPTAVSGRVQPFLNWDWETTPFLASRGVVIERTNKNLHGADRLINVNTTLASNNNNNNT